MEFHEKLQQLRKQKNLTQEELAQRLFVTRAAVSKWESGRGYPNIDSLKAIGQLFGVSVDALLSGEKLLSIAEAEGEQRVRRSREQMLGLLDLSALLLLILPVFGERKDGAVLSVPLLRLAAIAPYVKAMYWGMILSLALLGILILAIQKVEHPRWLHGKVILSLAFSVAAVLLFMVTLQPYPGCFLLILLVFKGILLVKKP